METNPLICWKAASILEPIPQIFAKPLTFQQSIYLQSEYIFLDLL